MGSLYERADIYDLFDNEEKYEAVKKHWMSVLKGKEIHSLLDISIGTGSLTLPLLDLDVNVSGSDLSKEMLARCDMKAREKGKVIELQQCDFRRLCDHIHSTFDCVGSTGNSLPYVTNDEILNVLEQMDQLVAKGGYLYYDMRNWDKILSEKNRFYLYNPHFKDDTRINLVQVWDYNADESMTFNLLYTFEKDNKVIQVEKFIENYHPVGMSLLLSKLKEMGYQEIQIMCHPAYVTDVDIKKVDWYCVIAKKPE